MTDDSDEREFGIDEDELAASMRLRSYAVVRLPRDAADAVRALLEEAPAFFAGDVAHLTRPPADADGLPTYRGLFACEQRKVLFARLTASGAPSPNVPSLPHLAPACRSLHSTGLRLLRMLACGLSLPPDALTSLVAAPPPTHVLSGLEEEASILSLFAYAPRDEPGSSPPCAEHVDYTLLTIAPFATAPGLEVLDLEAFAWVAPESAHAPVGPMAVVMAGESLEFVTRGRVSATSHRVSKAFGRAGRCSCPYLLHAHPAARLTQWPLPKPCARVGGADAPTEEPASPGPFAKDFVRAMQRKKASAVYSQ
jgi:isopenicillin N synthase-like dioxygenase